MRTICSWPRESMPSPNRRMADRLLKTAIELAGLKIPGDKAVSFSFVDSATIAETNWAFLRHKGDTDVISFNYAEDGAPCDDAAAEIIVCVDKAVKEGARRKGGYQRELVLYVVHGLLHVAGMDDQTPEQRREMRREERRIMAELEKRADFAKCFPGKG